MTTRLILWRHGVTDWNASGRFQGQTDIELNATGHAQAHRAAPVLAAMHPDALYSSPLRRARDTAQELAALTGLDVILDDRLAEINVGSWAGWTTQQAIQADPSFGTDLKAGRDHRRSPEGETSTEAGARIGAALADIATRHEGQTVVVTSHGITGRMGVAYLLGWDYATAIMLRGLDNTGWSVMERDAFGWRMRAYNVTAAASVGIAVDDGVNS
ncbi:MAG: histidine phosphatase family protein [Propionibacteriaceae bacterium]|nr:histidine phosphatase family protein [Propionibacteriaceae bacterium]